MNSKDIVDIGLEYFQKDFTIKGRERSLVYMRAITIELSRKYTKDSLSKIGSNYANSDHATVLHALRKFKDDYILQIEPFNVAEEYNALDSLICISFDIDKQEKEDDIIGGFIKDKSDAWLSARCIKLSKDVKRLEELNKELSNVNFIKVEERFIPIIRDLKDMSDIQLSEFHETRLKPYKKALESRVEQKVILKVAGAMLNR